MNKHKFLDNNMWLHKFLDGCAHFVVNIVKPKTDDAALMIGMCVIGVVCFTFMVISFYILSLIFGISVWWFWGAVAVAYILECFKQYVKFDK